MNKKFGSAGLIDDSVVTEVAEIVNHRCDDVVHSHWKVRKNIENVDEIECGFWNLNLITRFSQIAFENK